MSWGNPSITFGNAPKRYERNKRIALIRRQQEKRLREQQAAERRRMETAIDELDGCLDDE